MQNQVNKQSKKLMDAFDVGMKQYVKVLTNLIQYEEILIAKHKISEENRALKE